MGALARRFRPRDDGQPPMIAMTDDLPDIQPAHKKGDLVEGFRVLSEIGRGAASVIYLVQDPKTKQIWALKHVQKRNAKDQRFLDQAEMEQKIASSINHDSIRKIPKLIKKGSLLNTRELYLVMEFVDGVSLHEEIPPKLDQVIDVLRQTAHGLAQMHDAGFVHADMKPHNVIVGHDFDGNPTAKVIDLGQSCKIGTVKERIQGTPDYIAPEQVRRGEITPRTDIYNFGATMYWVLTGKNIPTAMGLRSDSLTNAIDESKIPAPTPLRQINPEVPERLEQLVLDCVKIRPEDRPADMHIVADKLDLILGIVRAAAEQQRAAANEG
ncbi:MAG: serine/threonine protein kinase [Planctomycetota bacterium]|nr:MAG: serine/threonine protein kinase [Planctomycetota bacterium]